jgi:hypothetical protein
MITIHGLARRLQYMGVKTSAKFSPVRREEMRSKQQEYMKTRSL